MTTLMYRKRFGRRVFVVYKPSGLRNWFRFCVCRCSGEFLEFFLELGPFVYVKYRKRTR